MNTSRGAHPDVLVVQHGQVKKGEEVTINFLPLGQSAKERKAQLKLGYGIECRYVS